MTGASIKEGVHAMPAAIVLLKTTLVLNVLSEHHQGAASKSAKRHDAIKIAIVEIGFVGCVAKGEAIAASYKATAATSNVAVGTVAAATSISVCKSFFTHGFYWIFLSYDKLWVTSN
mmetsp:Transcript_4647/g.6794  ORF Transcript_4647/g.6794 Transcript_4647/m.6794 type:complete len:117 (+) Transcript_4647:247-597(+)